jgi:hypothetical protein
MRMEEKICLTCLLLGTNHGFTTNPNGSVLQCSGNIPVHLEPKSLKLLASAGKVILTVFWDSQGVLLTSFQKRDGNVNCASYCEVLLKLLDAIRRKRPRQLTRGVLLHHDCQTPYRSSNSGENFLNICLTARAWPLVTSICLVR